MKALIIGAAVSMLSLGWTVADAALLVGASTFAQTDDLTVISISGGRRLEFLDLTTTVNMSVPTALSTVGVGFRWANEAEVAELFSAFGFPYLTPPTGTYVTIAGTTAASQLFIDYLGDTHPLTNLGMPAVAAIGFIDNGTANGLRGCISVNGCNPLNFVQDWSPHGSATTGSSIDTGVFLVRDSAVVSEPRVLALLALALLPLAATRVGRRPQQPARVSP